MIRFYGRIFLLTNVVTVGLLLALWPEKLGLLGQTAVYFTWGKLFTDAPLWYLHRSFDKTGLWFYHNLGLSERALYVGAFGLDWVVGLALLAVFSLFA
jgi:hypothetical protein